MSPLSPLSLVRPAGNGDDACGQDSMVKHNVDGRQN